MTPQERLALALQYQRPSLGDVGKGTRNFVVFPGEEQNLKILERE